MAKFERVGKKPKTPGEQFNIIRAEAEKATRRTINTGANLFRQPVSNWKSRPRFPTKLFYERGVLVGEIRITGSGIAKKKFRWTDEGTRPHVIRAKKKPFLRFQTGHQPKTTPGGRFGGPGTATGPWRTTKQVNHPGTEPRNITDKIKRILDPLYFEEMDAALNRGFKKALR